MRDSLKRVNPPLGKGTTIACSVCGRMRGQNHILADMEADSPMFWCDDCAKAEPRFNGGRDMSTKSMDAMRGELAKADNRVKALEEALLPFAALALEVEGSEETHTPCSMSIRELREAHSVWMEGKEDKP